MDPYAIVPLLENRTGRTSDRLDIAPDCLPDHRAFVGGGRAFSLHRACVGCKARGFAAFAGWVK